MGMYDTFFFNCPNCKEDTDVQTKLGECYLDNWSIGDETTIQEGIWGSIEQLGYSPELEMKRTADALRESFKKLRKD